MPAIAAVVFPDGEEREPEGGVVEAASIGREGNVVIIEVDGNYDRDLADGTPNTQAREAVALAYFAEHSEVDFLIVFTAFEIDTGSAAAFYTAVRNDTQGIGLPLFDHGVSFGSDRLQGFIDMAALAAWAHDPVDPAYQRLLGALSHELMHRWCCYVQFLNANGELSDALLGRADTHWSFLFDTDASVMYGNDWLEVTPGIQRSVGAQKRWHELDLYLAGLLPPQDVPTLALVDADLDPERLPEIGVEVAAERTPIAIGQIIAAEGPRISSQLDGPLRHDVGFVLLTRPGQSVGPLDLATLENIRLSFEQRVAAASAGAMVVHVGNSLPSDSGGAPTPVDTNGNTTQSPEVELALDWLEERFSDGFWQDKPGTDFRDTAAAVQALQQLRPDSVVLEQALAWLASQVPGSLEEHAARAELLEDNLGDVEAIRSNYNPGRGWGMSTELDGGVLDTARALITLLPDSADMADEWVGILVDWQNVDSGWPIHAEGNSAFLATLLAVRALTSTNLAQNERSAGLAWLASQQQVNGSFGQSADGMLARAADSVLVLAGEDTTADVEEALQFLLSSQYDDGSFGNSTYATARAAMAIAAAGTPNLTISSLSFNPNSVVSGQDVLVSVGVGNDGFSSAENVVVRMLIDGSGSSVADVIVPLLPPGNTESLTMTLPTWTLQNDVELQVQVDPEDVIAEVAEHDNQAVATLEVFPAPAGVELYANPASLSTIPDMVSSLPSQIDLSVQVSNLGDNDAPETVVRIERMDTQPPLVLAEIAQTIPARTAASIATTLDILSLPPVVLRVTADATNIHPEPDEDNNSVETVIEGADVTNLHVDGSDLQVVTVNPAAGSPVEIHSAIRNNGTNPVPPFDVALQVEREGQIAYEETQTLQVIPGEAQTLVWSFVPHSYGTHTLGIAIDPTDVIAESDESDNAASVAMDIGNATLPNLSIETGSVSVTPDPLLQGQPAQASLNIVKQGSEPVGAFDLVVFAGDPTTSLPIGATRLDEGLDEPQIVPVVVDLDSSLSTPVTLHIVVDAQGEVAETDEEDNLAIYDLAVESLPDLTISAADIVALPSAPVPGEALTVSVSVRNNGDQPAQDVSIAVLESRTTDSAAIVTASTIIQEIGGHEAHTVDFTWDFGQLPSADRIEAIVDEPDTVAELRESNNHAWSNLHVQNPDFYLTEPYISPNGDGTKDSTVLVVHLDQADDLTVDIFDEEGNVVHQYPPEVLAAVSDVALPWGGETGPDSLAADGIYRFEVRSASGALVGAATVVVDNNGRSVIDALGTPFEIVSPHCAAGFLVQREDMSRYRGTVFALGATIGGDDQPYRLFDLDASANTLVPVVRPNGSLVGELITHFEVLPPGDRLLMFSLSGKVYQAPLTLNAEPTLLFDTGYQISGGLDVYPAESTVLHVINSERVLMMNGWGSQYLSIDLATGLESPLTWPSNWEGITQAAGENGVLSLDMGFGGNQLHFIPSDGGSITSGLPQRSASVLLEDRDVAPDASHITLVQQSNSLERTEVVSTSSGVSTYSNLSQSVWGDASSINDGRWGTPVQQRFAFSPDGRRLAHLDAADRTFSVRTPDGTLLWSIPIEALPDEVPYSASFGSQDIEELERVISVPLPLSGQDLNQANGARPNRWIAWSPDSSRALIGVEHLVLGRPTSGGLTTISRGLASVLIVDLQTGTSERVWSFSSEWPVSPGFPWQVDSDDFRAQFEWIDDGLVMVRHEEPAPGQAGLPSHQTGSTAGIEWFHVGFEDFEYFHELSTRQFLLHEQEWAGMGIPGCQGRSMATTLSALNLISRLEVVVSPGGAQLSGTASDENFHSWELTWSVAGSATDRALVASGSNVIIGGDFAWWSPPTEGQYDLWLEVRDKAGNRKTSRRTLFWTTPADIGSVEVAPRYISPDSDGVQDTLRVDFDVQRPTEVLVRVLNQNGMAVRSEHLVFGANDLGANTWYWDGRDAEGMIVPDGVYALWFENASFIVQVDRTLPDVSIDWLPAFVPNSNGYANVEPTLAVSALDANFRTAELSFAEWWSPNQWQPSQNFSSPPITTMPMAFNEYRGRRYRIEVSDHAGNFATAWSEIGEDALYLYGRAADLPLERLVHQPPPFDDLPPLAEPLVVFGDSIELLAADLRHDRSNGIALQVSSTGDPSGWQSFTVDGAMIQAAPVEIAPEANQGIRVAWPSHWIPFGSNTAVRLASNDGSVYSNQTVFRRIGLVVRGDALASIPPGEDGNVLAQLLEEVPVLQPDQIYFWVRDYTPGLLQEPILEILDAGDLPPGVPTAYSPQVQVEGGMLFVLPDLECDAYEFQASGQFTGTDGVSYQLASDVQLVGFSPGTGCDGGNGGSNGGGNDHSVAIRARPHVLEACGGLPSGSVLIELALVENEPAGYESLSVYLNGDLDNPVHEVFQPTHTVPTQCGRINYPYDFALDTSGLGQGVYSLTVVAQGTGLTELSQQAVFVVDHESPTIDLTHPIPGLRVCATDLGDGGFGLPLTGSVSDDLRAGYFVDIAAPTAAAPWSTVAEDGVLRDPQDRLQGNAGCTPDPDGAVIGYVQAQYGGQLAALGDAELPMQAEEMAIRLRSSDWSGAEQCEVAQVEVDRTADAEVLTQSPSLIGPLSEPAAVSLAANEEVTVSADVYSANQDEYGRWIPQGSSVAQIITDVQVSGFEVVSWDGTDSSGLLVDDGPYLIVFEFEDTCGNASVRQVLSQVDGSPPSAEIIEPGSGAEISAAQPIVVSVDDANLANWTVERSQAGSGVWQTLASGVFAVSNELVAILAPAQPGQYDIRLSALDAAGNAFHRVHSVNFGQTTPLVIGADLSLSVFSPNGDGFADQTVLQVDLSRPAQARVDVLAADGGTVATLLDSPSIDGSVFVPWNGTAASGPVTPDGDYAIEIAVSDSAISQLLTLPVSVDTASPLIDLLVPESGVTSSGAQLLVNTSDPHFETGELQFVNSNGDVVRDLQTSQSGTMALSNLSGLKEGPYELVASASDRAGNESLVAFQTAIDNTLPVAQILDPTDQSVVSGIDGVVTLSGVIDDLHASRGLWRFREPGTQQWIDITTAIPASDGTVSASWQGFAGAGSYEIALIAEDLAGNITESTITLTLDAELPIAEIMSPGAGGFLRIGTPITGSASDENLLTYFVDLTPLGTGSETRIGQSTQSVHNGELAIASTLPADGEYMLNLRVLDAAGHMASAAQVVAVDQSPPAPPTALNANVQADQVSLHWQPPPNETGVRFRVSREQALLTPEPVTTPTFVDSDVIDGTYTYSVWSVDSAGNQSVTPAESMVTVDATPPDVSIVRPASGQLLRSIVEVDGTAFSQSDFDFYEVRLYESGTGNQSVLTRRTVAVSSGNLTQFDSTDYADGAYQIELEAGDQSGNLGITDLSIVLDNTPPEPPDSLDASVNGSDVALSWPPVTSADLLGYLLFRNGVLVNAPSSLPPDLRQFALEGLEYVDTAVPDGENQYVVRSIDQAGNVSSASPVATADIESGPPHAEITSPSDGHRFDGNLSVQSSVDDSDVSSVTFAWAVSGGGAWTVFGVDSNEPFSAIFDTDGFDYGSYQLTAIAEDNGGLVDPSPEVVHVTFTDLDPPDQVQGLAATADGGMSSLNWNPVNAPDLSGYHIERSDSGAVWQRITAAPVSATSYGESGLADGQYAYRVVAVDQYENEAPPSMDASILVHTPILDPITSPRLSGSIDVSGSAIVSGEAIAELETGDGVTPLGSVPVIEGVFQFPSQTVSAGDNILRVWVDDGVGNLSKVASRVVVAGDMPEPPENLSANVNGHDVSLIWDPSPSSNVVGYRPYINGTPILPDTSFEGLAIAMASHQAGANVGPENVLDSDTQTTWQPYTNWDFGQAPWIRLDFIEPIPATGMLLDWASSSYSATELLVEAWDGHGWHAVALASLSPAQSQPIQFDRRVMTDRLRITVTQAAFPFFYRPIRLAEVTTRTLGVVQESSFDHTVIDGTWNFGVTAISDLVFESAPAEIQVSVGDTTPPQPVQLLGSVDGTTAQLTWTASGSADVTAYEVAKSGQPIVTVDSSTLQHQENDLPDGTHVYTVVAIDAVGLRSPPSNEVALTVDASNLLVPELVAVTPVASGGALSLVWSVTSTDDLDGFEVRRSMVSGGPYTTVATTSELGYLDENLNNGTHYFYVVSARDALGNVGAPSNELGAVPADTLAPSPPVLTAPTVAGQPLTLSDDRASIAGLAEPGNRVRIEANATPLGEVLAQPVFAIVEPPDLASGAMSLSPSGRYAQFSGSPDVIRDLVSGSTLDLPTETGTLRWAPSQDMAFLQGFPDREQIYRVDPATGGIEVITQMARTDAIHVSPQGAYLVLIGRQDYGDQLSALLYSVGTGDSHRIADWGSIGHELGNLVWAPDGSRLAYADGDELVVVDVSDLAESRLDLGLGGDLLAWSPGGEWIAYQAGADAEATLSVYDFVMNEVSVIAAGGGHVSAFIGPEVLAAVNEDNALTLWRLSDLSQLGSAAITDWSYSYLSWHERGILTTHAYGFLREWVEPAGLFRLVNAQLSPGFNLIDAYAIDDSGNVSLPAAPIEVYTPTVSRPDLEVTMHGVSVVPATVTPGSGATLFAEVGNRGEESAPASRLEVRLVSPTGTPESTLSASVPALPSEDSALVSVVLPAFDSDGLWTAYVVADADDQIEETTEVNNSATLDIPVIPTGGQSLSISADPLPLTADGSLLGTIVLANDGATFDGQLVALMLDSANEPVELLLDEPIVAMSTGQVQWFDFNWSADGYLAGTYVVRATLFIDGEAATASEISVVLLPDGEFVLSAVPDATLYANGDLAEIEVSLAYESGNAVVQDLPFDLSVVDAGGDVVSSDYWTSGVVLPGSNVTWVRYVDTSALSDGIYEAHVSVQALGQHLLSVSQFAIEGAAAETLSGEITPPVGQVSRGESQDLSVSITNSGSQALDGVQWSLSTYSDITEPPVSQLTGATDLEAGEAWTQPMTISTVALALGNYSHVLSVNGGEVLALATLSIVDGNLPQITNVVPGESQFVSSTDRCSAVIVDADSAVTTATCRFDDRTPIVMGLSGPSGLYTGFGAPLEDGTHTVLYRAQDAWGNLAESGRHTFVVDSDSPLIVNSGVVDGQVGNDPVTPVVTIVDDNPGTHQITLNGQPFNSGDEVSTEGTHWLRVVAVDLAGNSSESQLAFTIDLTAPAVQISSPTNGDTVTSQPISVLGSTEAGAEVSLQTGTHQDVVNANAAGVFSFASVPLAEGTNLLTVVASDSAGNVSEPETVEVSLQQPVAVLSGIISGVSDPAAHGVLLGGIVQIANDGAVDATDIPLRLQAVELAVGEVVDLVEWQLDIAAGETQSLPFAMSTDLWALGTYDLRLAVMMTTQRGDQWVQLANLTFDLTDQTAPELVVVSPGDGDEVDHEFDIVVAATDSLSAISSVEARIDSGPWLSLSLVDPASGQYSVTINGLEPGNHTLIARATDVASNIGQSLPVQFTVRPQFLPMLVLEPQDGAQLPVGFTRVSGITEAHAIVTVSVSQGDVQATADSQGLWVAHGLPVTHGDNQLVVSAVNADGLASNPIVIRVVGIAGLIIPIPVVSGPGAVATLALLLMAVGGVNLRKRLRRLKGYRDV